MATDKNDNMNIIKTRDDQSPLYINSNKQIENFEECSWGIGKDEDIDDSLLRNRIEPWLTALFQSEHLSLLCGSGLTHAVHYLACGEIATGMDLQKFSTLDNQIQKASKDSALKSGREEANIEDQIRVVNELIRGMEIFGAKRADNLHAELNDIIANFGKSILKSENHISTANNDKRGKAFNTLMSFLLSFSSRTATRERLNVFTTNYDRLIEVGSDLAGLHVMDRFVGSIIPIFRSSRMNLDIHYNPPGMRGEPRYLEGVIRLTKLHGSVDWVQKGDEIRRIGLPFGANDIKPFLDSPGLQGLDYLKMMIYPNSAKDRETAEYPYVELFRDFASAICRPNSSLFTYGYSFGDDHINRVIKDMLTIPSTHLVIMSHDDTSGRLMKFYNSIGRPSQISLLIGNRLGDLSNLAFKFLPKASIDKTTIRMAEIIQKRFDPQQEQKNKTDNDNNR